MSDGKDSSEFERRAKRTFDDSVAALDGATRSRLTLARHRALDEQALPRNRRWLSTLVPAGAAAAMAFVAWLVVWQPPPTTEVVQDASLGDLEILLGEEDLEMLDEELEFYGWLEQQPEFANAGDSVG
jgi:hypothetical protein